MAPDPIPVYPVEPPLPEGGCGAGCMGLIVFAVIIGLLFLVVSLGGDPEETGRSFAYVAMCCVGPFILIAILSFFGGR